MATAAPGSRWVPRCPWLPTSGGNCLRGWGDVDPTWAADGRPGPPTACSTSARHPTRVSGQNTVGSLRPRTPSPWMAQGQRSAGRGHERLESRDRSQGPGGRGPGRPRCGRLPGLRARQTRTVLTRGPHGLRDSGLDSRLPETQKNSNSGTTWKNVGRVSVGALGVAAAVGARILARVRGASETGACSAVGAGGGGGAGPEGGDRRRPAWTVRVRSRLLVFVSAR